MNKRKLVEKVILHGVEMQESGYKSWILSKLRIIMDYHEVNENNK